jgi:hypothetical protein
MPCYDGRNDGYVNSAWHDSEMRSLRDRNDKLAEMLCYVMRNGGPFRYPDTPTSEDRRIQTALTKWWDDHQKFDQKRKRKK